MLCYKRRPSASLVINEDIHVELLELLELYCEILLARFGLLDQKYVMEYSDFHIEFIATGLESRTQVGLCFNWRRSDVDTYHEVTGILEGVCSVIHAAPRTEIKGIKNSFVPDPNLNYSF